jgi:hypothetical protein
MTSRKWLDVPVELVPISELYATQPGVLFAALIDPQEPVGGDSFPHVAVCPTTGRYLLEDGHHRILRDAMRGLRITEARVLRLAP